MKLSSISNNSEKTSSFKNIRKGKKCIWERLLAPKLLIGFNMRTKRNMAAKKEQLAFNARRARRSAVFSGDVYRVSFLKFIWRC